MVGIVHMSMDHEKYLHIASDMARKSLCLKKRCGSIIVKNDEIIGVGYNAPPLDDLSHRLCGETHPSKLKPKSDRTCCVHAEWRSVINALARPRDLVNSTLYYASVDPSGNLAKAGKPYCTVCSRLALDSGVASWILWHESGIRQYDADEYNMISYQYDNHH